MYTSVDCKCRGACTACAGRDIDRKATDSVSSFRHRDQLFSHCSLLQSGQTRKRTFHETENRTGRRAKQRQCQPVTSLSSVPVSDESFFNASQRRVFLRCQPAMSLSSMPSMPASDESFISASQRRVFLQCQPATSLSSVPACDESFFNAFNAFNASQRRVFLQCQPATSLSSVPASDESSFFNASQRRVFLQCQPATSLFSSMPASDESSFFNAKRA